MATTIGTYLRRIRMARGGTGAWSLRSVAKRAGISDAYLSQLETGKVKQPLPKVLKNISSVFKVPYEEILGAAGYLTTNKPSVEVIEIPVCKDLGSQKFPVNLNNCKHTIWISNSVIKSRNCIALTTSGKNFLRIDPSGDGMVIVALDQQEKNGDMVLANTGNTYAIKKLFTKREKAGGKYKLILQDPSGEEEPLITESGKKAPEIIGTVTRIITPP